MNKITRTRTIQAPAGRVWNILADFSNVYVFHPLVDSSHSTNGQDTGLGAKRQCDLYNGGIALEEITAFDPERRHMEIAVEDGPGPFLGMTGAFTVTPLDDQSFSVRAELAFGTRDGVNAGDLAAAMEGVVESVLKGLDDHAVIGAMIGSGGEHLSTPAAMPG